MIYLVRHGLDDERFIGGFSDVGLTFKGKLQVKEMIEFLKETSLHFDRIYSSDIKRARETAEMIGEEFKVPILLDERLREQDKGIFNGEFAIKAKIEHPNFFENIKVDTVYPEGESLNSFHKRIYVNLPFFLEQNNSLVVTHRGVINAIYYDVNQIPVDMDKEKFGVTHASIHEYNPKTKTIRKIY